MVAARLLKEPDAMIDRPAFRIIGAVIDPTQPGSGDGRGTHRARLERDIEIEARQPRTAQRKAG